jgi:putative ABC transport system permease protein
MTAFTIPGTTDPVTINSIFADPAFTSTMKFQLVAGRDFNKDLASDSANLILNEAAVKALNLKNPIGTDLADGRKVIGIVRDFHWESLRNKIAPCVITPAKQYMQMSFRLNPQASAAFITAVSAKWKQLVPGEPLKYHFLDDNFNDILKKERVLSKIITFFTILAIFISCLGLYGLSAYTTEQRSKEISIRKVLGATVSGIVTLLNRKFALLIGLAVIISVPISWFVMQRWVEGFAYRTEITAGIFVSSIALAFVIALLTVSFHSIKAALVNPASTLKYE